jgi:hypothetical protein
VSLSFIRIFAVGGMIVIMGKRLIQLVSLFAHDQFRSVGLLICLSVNETFALGRSSHLSRVIDWRTREKSIGRDEERHLTISSIKRSEN